MIAQQGETYSPRRKEVKPMKTLDTVRGFCRNHASKIAAGVAAGAAVISVPSIAGATAPTIETTFASTQASLLTELGYGVALVVALLLVGLGVRMIVKWSKKGVSAG
jgi:predicted transporter